MCRWDELCMYFYYSANVVLLVNNADTVSAIL